MKICFDMDGTIADLYGVENWLPLLQAENPTPYANAVPLVRMARLAKALHKAQSAGHEIVILSWLSKNGSEAYGEAVSEAKRKWLAQHLPSVRWDEIIIVAYGTPKETLANGILFDDEEQNRIAWGEGAYEPKDIFDILATLCH